MLFQVTPARSGPRDPAMLGAVVVLLVAITLTACFVPEWRATRIDPVVALRTE
jgi:ABC-type lipoprotein release transport system permease subunit